MVFTLSAAATMAQVLAVLLLASAFAPEYRGLLGTRTITDTEGQTHRVPKTRAGAVRLIARYRLATMLIVLLTLWADVLLLILNITATGFGGMIIVPLNGISVGIVIGHIGGALFSHANSDDGAKQQKPGYRD